MEGSKILIVEDEAVISFGIKASLERAGYSVLGIVTTGEEAVAMALERRPDIILMDIILEGSLDGIEAARRIRQEVDIPVIYLTANADERTVNSARDTMPYGYLNKPINERDLLTNIDSAVQLHRVEMRLKASEEKYRRLIESLNDIIITTDENGIVTYISPQIKMITDYDASEVVGKNFSLFIYPEDVSKAVAHFYAAKDGGLQRQEFRAVTKSGKVIWLRSSGAAAFENGRFIGVRGVLSDITLQKTVEDERERSAAFLAAVFDSIQDGISVLDTELRIVRVNEVMRRWYRHHLPLEGKKCFEAYHGRKEACDVCPSRRALLTGNLEVDFVPLAGADGLSGTLELFSYPMKDAEGRITGIVEFVRDVTARKAAEDALHHANQELAAANEALQEAVEELEETNEEFERQNRELLDARNEINEREVLLRSIMSTVPVGIGLIVDRTIQWSNSALHAMTGYSENELRGNSTRILYPSDEEYDRAGRELGDRLAKRGTGVITTQWKRRGGTVIDVEVRATLVDVKRREAGTIVSAVDITDQKRAMEALAESERLFRTMVEYAPIAIAIMDNNGRITYLNRAFITLTGYTTAEIPTVQDWWEKTIPEDSYRAKAVEQWETSLRLAQQGETITPIEGLVRCADGSFKSFEFRLIQIGEKLLAMLNDITEKKVTQEVMIQTEKMASIGGLAAGMAHEINNPLSIILQGAQCALDRLDPGSEANREAAERAGVSLDAVRSYLEEREIIYYLKSIVDAGERAARIVSSMLQFSRRDQDSIIQLNLKELVERTIELAGTDYNIKSRAGFEDIRIIREYDENLPPVPCSPTGIEQVLLNLIKNAAQALRSPGEAVRNPTIMVRTRKEGGFAVLEIEDNGPGIAKELQRRIFEPFFTTKQYGQGTGLGLSVSSYIVAHNHRGSLTVDSEPGKGARFIVRLPLERKEEGGKP